ncbi:MAG: protein translocase subunit SecF, partial [Kangiellaceae bacterium]|nr:protein translocase subunit SecF [Kangiellaceae bacterium]
DDIYWIVRSAEVSSINSNNNWVEKLSQSLNSENSLFSNGGASQIITPMDSDFIDSQIGEELIEQGGLSLMAALLVVLVYLATRYEWRFALGAIWALLHDVIIVIGLFAWLQLEMNLTVLAAFLAIVGYSLNDSIVLLDKIREFMHIDSSSEINELVNKSIQATLGRTLITSGTTLITISAIWWLAGLSLNEFSVALFAGILVGTFSSIGISATLPVLLGIKSDYFIQKEHELMKLREEP